MGDSAPDGRGRRPETEPASAGEPTQVGGAVRDDTLPEFIGRYRILGRIGEGGMGTVYEAEQENPRRRVAVKIVRGGRSVDGHRVRMFQREAETLARLAHPNIGAIYESGTTDDGRHFFAMELVRGETLREFIQRRSGPLTTTELRLRLGLLQKIADAVHYAHQRGVIHRDLKPSNVVVIGATASKGSAPVAERTSAGARIPEVKILDFGVARITGGDVAAVTVTTEVGVIKGTLPYMSPEQARGRPEEIDIRTDVYALGVMLYEMLAARLPYDVLRRSLAEAVRVICEEVPRPLGRSWSGLRRLDPDVETIVGKALEKEASRRYASAAALSEDIGRYLSSLPILARPPSTVYQLRKFASRNRGLVGGIAATFVMLLAGIVVSVSLGMREASQRRGAEKARSDLQRVVAFQAGMLSGVDPQRMGRILMDDLRQQVAEEAGRRGAPAAEIERALEKLHDAMGTNTALHLISEEILSRAGEQIARDESMEPLIAARLHHTLADTYGSLGLYGRSEPHILEALRIRKQELGAEHRDTLRSRFEFQWALVNQGRYEEAAPRMEELLETQRRVLGEHDPDMLDQRGNLAHLYVRMGRYGEAERLHRETLEARVRIFGERSEPAASSMLGLANALAKQGRYDESERLYLDAIEIDRRLNGEDAPSVLRALSNLATDYLEQQRYGEAETIFLEVLETRRRVLGDEHQGTLNTTNNLANVYHGQGRYEEAERLHRRTLEICRRVYREGHPKTLRSLENLARALDELGRGREAEELFVESLAGYRRELGDRHPDTLKLMMTLGVRYGRQGRHEEAEPLLAEALEIQRTSLGEDHVDTLMTMSDLANVLKSLGRHDEAEQLYVDAFEELRRLGDERSVLVAYNLACLSAIRNERRQALDYLRRSVDGGLDIGDWIVKDPELRSLHGDPEFEEIAALALGTP